MKIAIIDYGSGNLRSVAKAFERAAADAGLRVSVCITSTAEEVAKADRVVLPGVGAFADCRSGLMAVPGLMDAICYAVVKRACPFLGICVGMQMMATNGFEHGEAEGFNWVPGSVMPLSPSIDAGPSGTGARIPHMGWNRLRIENAHPVLAGLGPEPFAYFLHSYHLQCEKPAQLYATVDYGQVVTAAVGRDNLFGTQFHPEKSQSLGLALITNFLRWVP